MRCIISCKLQEPADAGSLVAEGKGFEPMNAFASPVFKTGAINRSATPPVIYSNSRSQYGQFSFQLGSCGLDDSSTYKIMTVSDA